MRETPAWTELLPARGPVWLSGACWLALLADAQGTPVVVRYCSPGLAGPMELSAATTLRFLALGSAPAVLLSWTLMVGAMMGFTLIGPFHHLWDRSLVRHRPRALGLFIAGYLMIWFGACSILFAVSTSLIVYLGPGLAPFGSAVLIALIWYACPFRKVCLRRCHRVRPLAIFGFRAFSDPLLFGGRVALWCSCSCWGVMLAGMSGPGPPLISMAVVTAVIALERLLPLECLSDVLRLGRSLPRLVTIRAIGESLRIGRRN